MSRRDAQCAAFQCDLHFNATTITWLKVIHIPSCGDVNEYCCFVATNRNASHFATEERSTHWHWQTAHRFPYHYRPTKPFDICIWALRTRTLDIGPDACRHAARVNKLLCISLKLNVSLNRFASSLDGWNSFVLFLFIEIERNHQRWWY